MMNPLADALRKAYRKGEVDEARLKLLPVTPITFLQMEDDGSSQVG